jgi:hypothetical protein
MRRGTTTQRAVSKLVAVGFVVGLAGGVAGCTNYPEPSHLPTPTETVTPSPSPTPTPTPTPDAASVPPERPAAMDVVDSAGAEAVAVYFLALVPYANATGDLADLASLSHPECIFCASVQDGVETLVAAGQHTVGGTPTVASVTSLEVDPGRWWTVNVDLDQEPQQVLDTSGTVVTDVAEIAAYHFDVAVVRDDDRWLVRAVSHQKISDEGA